MTKHEEDRLRAQQAKAVMPMIGPLLDAWEAMPLELRSDMIEQAAPLMRWLGAINDAALCYRIDGQRRGEFC